MQRLLLPMNSSTGLLLASLPPPSLKGAIVPCPPSTAFRSGALTLDTIRAEKWHQMARGFNMELPGGYNMMDATSRLSVLANNVLRIAQAWGWDFEVGEHRFFQPSQHKWETTSRDLGNNALSNSLISLVKGDFLSNLVLNGLVKAAYTSKPEVYLKADSPWERTQKIWHNMVRHPVRQTFGLSADPLTTIGHVLPPKERHWLKMNPLDSNIKILERFGDALSLKTTFEAIQQAIEATDHPSHLLDNARKAGARRELKQLFVGLQPDKTIKPQVMNSIGSLFDEKTGALKEEAAEQALQVKADLQYFLALYQPCGGAGASDEGIAQLLQQLLETKAIRGFSEEGLLTVKSAKERAMAQANDWFKGINAHWKNDANQAVRLSTQVILEHLVELYKREHEKALQAGKNSICKQTLAKRFALEVAPKLMSKTGNTYSGELAGILEPAFQLSQRTALLAEYEDHRNAALLSQTITQALFTCFVLGNLLFFIVFNTLARLDVDFKGPHGETRLDFGELKRLFKRWLKKQLGQEVEEPQARMVHPKVSLELSLGGNLALKQQLFNRFERATTNEEAINTTLVTNEPFVPAPSPSSYLRQSVGLDVLDSSPERLLSRQWAAVGVPVS